MLYCLLSTTVVSKQTAKPGGKKAAVSGASLESDPGEKIVYHTACSMCNTGCCNYSLFGLEIDDSRQSKSSSPPPSLRESHNQRAECNLLSKRYAPSSSFKVFSLSVKGLFYSISGYES